jgi:hypothetical protein
MKVRAKSPWLLAIGLAVDPSRIRLTECWAESSLRGPLVPWAVIAPEAP